MATPRRSTRLRGNTPEVSPMPSASLTKLAPLSESGGDSDKALQNNHAEPLDQITSPTKLQAPKIIRTPSSSSKHKPDSNEMHPKHHQSTNKKVESSRRLGMMGEHLHGRSPSGALSKSTSKAPLFKAQVGAEGPLSSTSFDFRFNRPSTGLSPEGKKLMEEIRDQAAKIKSELAAQRDEQTRKDSEADSLFGAAGRRIATPKGRTGRFSNVHQDQFKKMDSIANHPSSFRADPARFQPAAKTLKRSNSKAELDSPGTPKRISPSNKVAISPSKLSSSPVKRFKHQHESTMVSKADSPHVKGSSLIELSRPTSGIPTPIQRRDVTTPTRAGLVRSASSKSLKPSSSIIPDHAQPASTKSLVSPVASRTIVAQSENSNKYHNSLASRLTQVKSILRKPQLRFSNDPMKLAAGTHVSANNTPDIYKTLPHLPLEDPSTPTLRKEKRVNFSPSPAKVFGDSLPSSPVTPNPKSVAVGYRLSGPTVEYPALPPIDHDSESPPRVSSADSATERPTDKPGDFTFRAGSTISFAQNQSSSTIRQVRAADSAEIGSVKLGESSAMPKVPHGLSNKKRKRDSEEQDAPKATENKENEHAEVPAKRAKIMRPSSTTRKPNTESMSRKTPSSSQLPKAKGKGVLSLSRLNALAQPKQRKS